MDKNSASGSIGIGAMIIFIALILVAAISSSVIMEMAEKLKEDGDSTSNDVQYEVSKRVKLTGAYIRSVGGNCNVVLFQHAGFGGWSATFGVGDFLVEDFIAAGAVDNDASSIRIEEGCAASMFEGENFDGAWEAEVGEGNYDLGDLQAVGLENDQLSSMKIKGFGLLLIIELAAGSPPIQAGDIGWSVACNQEDGSFGFDFNTITLSGSRLSDGLNTFGQDFDILPTELITGDMAVHTELDFIQCVPEVGERIELNLHVEFGATTSIQLPFDIVHEIGNDLLHQP
tara:strand:+ start:57282 stop:58139 length:858 start_codon:yes stop_codon:yes gene_type:complete